MRLNPLGPNRTEVDINSSLTVFFSYKTPVAAFVGPGSRNRLPVAIVQAMALAGTAYLRTTAKHSMTTTRHVNHWLGGVYTVPVAQEVLDNLVSEGDNR